MSGRFQRLFSQLTLTAHTNIALRGSECRDRWGCRPPKLGISPTRQITVEDAFGSGDKVAARWSGEMTHTGDDIGIPATGRTVRICGMTFARVENGKVVEAWNNWDQLGLQQQLS